ncbi:MAG: hypothetical protein AMK73_07140 [Planctomycetes bacterium SM23_32]|nr:MAG: hypothetical protein AMK73_07140 [Planctomycetes bacterium SM23_32]
MELRDDALIVDAADHGQAGVSVTCRFRTEPESGLILGSISVRCASEMTLASVRFPLLPVRLPIGDAPEDDAVLLPYCDGCVVRDPLANGLYRDLQYPGTASMQMLAAFDPAAGVYLACHDAQGYAKRIFARRWAEDLHLSAVHLAEQVPREEWALPYEAAITTFRGAEAGRTRWEDAAGIYRRWAVRQPWCRATLAERVRTGDVPAWLAEPSLFYTFTLRARSEDGQEVNQLDRVVYQAEAWRQVLGEPVTFMLMSWEKRGPWVTPDYFPPYGGTVAFRQATGGLHAHGHRTLVFLSGLRWTLHKEFQGNVVDDEAAFNERARPSAIADASGEAVMYGEPDRDVGRHAQVCAATPLAREILVGSSLRCQELGIDCVQVDQIVGGGLPPCYSPLHGHPPGGGNWCARALYDVFAEIRRRGRARDPDFAFSIEEPAEYFIPLMDTYHARDYMQGRWPRDGAGTVGVPLFAHVYHDYVHGYGGDSCSVTHHDSRTAVYEQAMNLVCGKAPGVAVWGRWYEPGSTHQAQQRLLKGHCELWRGPARDFLVLGQRTAAPALDVPQVEVTFYDWHTREQMTLAFPAVLHSAWRSPDGRTGTVYACIASEPITFETPSGPMTLAPGEAAFKQGEAG